MARKRANPKNREWSAVWSVVADLSGAYVSDIVFIGGIATYAYTHDLTAKPEVTRDADAAADHAVVTALASAYDVTENKRLQKAQVVIDGVEVDLYVGRKTGLRYQFPELVRHRRHVGVGRVTVPVASVAHLILLKLDAFAEREGSAHGDKDVRDVAKLLAVIEDWNGDAAMLSELADKNDRKLLVKVVKAMTPFLDIADGNAKVASMLRRKAIAAVEQLDE
jgi:hypothetical protein